MGGSVVAQARTPSGCPSGGPGSWSVKVLRPSCAIESVHGSRLPIGTEAPPGSFPLIFTTAERGIGPPLESLRRFSEPRPAGTTLKGPCGANSSSASILPREARF
jgi:hypothetical protein